MVVLSCTILLLDRVPQSLPSLVSVNVGVREFVIAPVVPIAVDATESVFKSLCKAHCVLLWLVNYRLEDQSIGAANYISISILVKYFLEILSAIHNIVEWPMTSYFRLLRYSY